MAILLRWANSRSRSCSAIFNPSMAYTIILHLTGEASVLGEIEELPKPTDNIITLTNPRLRDGKDIHYLEQNVTKVIWPLAKIALIEVLESQEEENLIGFVRE